MNKVFLSGRLTRDPELRKTNGNLPVATFRIATDEGKDANGDKISEFHSCVAWRNKAEVVSKYFKQGDPITVIGKLKSRSYEKDGQKRKVTEVYVTEVEFPLTKKADPEKKGFIPIDVDDGELPY